MLLGDGVHDAGDLEVLGLRELSQDGLQLRSLDQTCKLEVVLSAILQIAVDVARVVDQVASPHTLLA